MTADEYLNDAALVDWWNERRPELRADLPLTPARRRAIRSAWRASQEPVPALIDVPDVRADPEFEPGELVPDDIHPTWTPERSGTVLVRMADVVPERVEWLWEARIPRGKVTALDGDPGLGKSQTMTSVCARVTTGAPMPDGSRGVPPADVVICSAEDGIADTIVPRLLAAGADLERVYTLTIADEAGERTIAIPDDLAHLEDAVVARSAALVVIDPLMAHLPSTVNSYRDQDVRRALAPLAALAERTGCAMVVIRHLNKMAGGNPLYRGGGSIGIIGAARSGLLAASDPDDETGTRRVLAVMKSNLAPIAPALSYTIESVTVESPAGPIATSRVAWGEVTEHTAAQLLAVPANADDRSALHDGEDVLTEILADGPMPARDVQAAARQAGISERTLDRAKAALHVVSKREGFGAGSRVLWRLPHTVPIECIERQPQTVAPYGDVGTLCAPEAVETDYPASAWDPDDEPGSAADHHDVRGDQDADPADPDPSWPCPECGRPTIATTPGDYVCEWHRLPAGHPHLCPSCGTARRLTAAGKLVCTNPEHGRQGSSP